ncbi:MAG: DUF87 domain-containing protein [Acidimicrobiia bacterium]
MADGFFIGEDIDAATGKRNGNTLRYDPDALTTHGVIVGMTGSGKTGLGVVVLEEALSAGLPAIIIDPKGDLGDLLLTFPDLAPADFAPWVEPDASGDRNGPATKAADQWRNGLASWGLDGSRIRAFRDRVDFTIYTPGSSAGVPLNVLGSLKAPEAGTDTEALREEIEGYVSGLLGMIGIAGDPLTSREHILLANVIEKAWTAGTDLDLGALLGQVIDPPLRKLGVFDLDQFFPKPDRMALAMKLNGLVASPGFAAWTTGAPLDIGQMLAGADGKTGAAIINIAPLSDEERQFVVTLVLSKVVSWMRHQAGTSHLRALVYMDEVYGYVPPSAMPPAKKPILTLLKQARAFGVGVVLATQNPVDLDYKALSNTGTWMIGRLQTEQDKNRLVDGLRTADGSADVDELNKTISALQPRQFLLHSTKGVHRLFNTRWALSYLPGPLSREQISSLMAAKQNAVDTLVANTASPVAPGGPAAGGPADDETAVAPTVASGVRVAYLDPAAPWAPQLGFKPTGTRYEAAIAARVHLLFDDEKAGVNEQEEWEAILYPLTANPDPATATAVDYDDRDLRTAAPGGATFVLPDAPIHTTTYFRGLQGAIRDELLRTRTVTVYRNSGLKLFSRVGESKDDFLARCQEAAENLADADAAKLKDKIDDRKDRISDMMARAEDRAEQLKTTSRSKVTTEVVSAAGSILGALLGGKTRTKSIVKSMGGMASRRGQSASARQRAEDAQHRIDEHQRELDELEADLADELAKIDRKWDDVAAAVDDVEIDLEKTDITVDELVLVWVPTA